MRYTVAATAAIVIALAATTASAGIIISEDLVITDQAGKQHKSEQSVMLQGSRQRVVTPARAIITDLDAGKMDILIPASKRFGGCRFRQWEYSFHCWRARACSSTTPNPPAPATRLDTTARITRVLGGPGRGVGVRRVPKGAGCQAQKLFGGHADLVARPARDFGQIVMSDIRLSIVVPAYNEERRIEASLRKIRAYAEAHRMRWR